MEDNFNPYNIHKRSITGLSQDVATGQWSIHFRKKNKASIEISVSDAIILHQRLGHAMFCCEEALLICKS